MGQDQLLQAYLSALAAGVSQSHIARETGIPRGSLRQFKMMSALGPDRRDALQAWLVANGHWEGPRSPWPVVSARLRGLLAVVESKASDDDKRSALLFELDLLAALAKRTQ